MQARARRSFLKYVMPFLLRSGVALKLGEVLAASRRRGRPVLKAVEMMGRFGMSLTRRAYSGHGPIWTNAFAPTEIVYAMGLVPFSPEIASATAASMGLSDFLLDQAEENWFSADTCTFHRCALGGALAGYLPKPAGLGCTAHICDGTDKLFANLSHIYGVPYFLVDTPFVDDEEALEYLTSEMELFARYLEERSGKRLKESRLEEAISRSNEARRWMIGVNRLRRSRPAPMKGSEAFGFLFLVFVGQGSGEAVEIYHVLFEELSERVKNGIAASQRERHRLLWLHLKPYYPDPILSRLEDGLGAVIAFEEMNHVYWDELDPSRPFESLARKALAHFGYGPAKRRIDTITRLVDDYLIDGVVHFSHWGCRQSCGLVPMIREVLRSRGVPFLNLEGDCVDRRSRSQGQLDTRIEAFVEVLEGGLSH